ncbi:hypothetical protein QFC19_003960 [Naganishia cerealis]|uniref:Uncharacterized protein n=1 Tax=Naganishia cerealis TaxID=610337 RepID=A0ACC2VXW4_9TREE|nr:hypothetical protein QFC19_003960 [Naganishia cerealis]
MSGGTIPTDDQVWKQVRKCLSLDDDDETTPVPPFLFQPIKDFMITNPEDDEFVIECSVPGKSQQPYGEVTCTLQGADAQQSTGKAAGNSKEGKSSPPILFREARKAREAARNSSDSAPNSSRKNQSSAMQAKATAASFLSERKPDIKPTAVHGKSEVMFSNSKSQIKADPGGSKRPIFVVSDSDDSDDDLKSKVKRLKPSSSVTASTSASSHSTSDRGDRHEKTLNEIISSSRTSTPLPNVAPLSISSAVNARASGSQMTLDRYLNLPPQLQRALPSGAKLEDDPVEDTKPKVPVMNQHLVASSSAMTPAISAVPVVAAPVTLAELDTAEQLAMCRKALTLSAITAFPAKTKQIRDYLMDVARCQYGKTSTTVKATQYFPELIPYAAGIQEMVKTAFRAEGRTLPEVPRDAPSAMSLLSDSLALQNMAPFNQFAHDYMGRMLNAVPGHFDNDDEDAAENRRLAVKNADDLQTFFKDALDTFSENVTVSDAAQKLGLTHMNDLLEGMSVPLMPHQIIGVQWMVDKERSKHHGGILADSMGLGKTIQAIATIVANPSEDPSCKTTLIVAPVALLEQWKLEIENKTYGQLDVYIFHGTNKNISKKKLKKYDVVITTYGTLVQQFPAPEKKTKKKPNDFIELSAEEDEFRVSKVKVGPLALIHWYRVVLDEAAQIRNRRTRAAKACFELDATNRWVLSGTLIVNSLEDMFSYFHFLALSECSDWDTFRKRIIALEKKQPRTACNRIQAILKFGCMRRTKDTLVDGKPLLQLPEKKVDVVEEDFDEDERNLYTAAMLPVEQKARLRFNRYLRAGTVLKNMRNVLIMILRLRQICAHASLIVRKPGEVGHQDDLTLEAGDDRLTSHKAFQENSDVDKEDEVGRARKFGGDALVDRLKAKRTEDDAQQANGEESDFQCAICFEPFLDNERITSVFEPESVVKSEDVKAEQEEMISDLDLSSFTRSKGKGKGKATDLEDEEGAIILPSAKMRKTSELVNGWLAANQEDKVVIFSQFVTFINLVRDHLEGQGIECYTYTGGMSKSDRDSTIANFTSPRNPVRVIIISTKAGGVGLNLTIASKAICLAIDRIHRIGQTKPVHVQRVVIPNSVEQRILALQEKKAALAEGAYGEGAGGKLGRLSVGDLMALFDVRREGLADEEL